MLCYVLIQHSVPSVRQPPSISVHLSQSYRSSTRRAVTGRKLQNPYYQWTLNRINHSKPPTIIRRIWESNIHKIDQEDRCTSREFSDSRKEMKSSLTLQR